MTEPVRPPMGAPASQPPSPPLPPAAPGRHQPSGPAPAYAGPALVAERKDGPGFLVRAVWFVFVGWWLTGIVSTLAWVAMLTMLGLPLGIWLINRIPTALTLRPRTSYVWAYTDAYGAPRYGEARIAQPAWPIRGLWFIVVGWWASAFVMALGYLLIVLVITLPLGLMLYNRVPFVASLYRY